MHCSCSVGKASKEANPSAVQHLGLKRERIPTLPMPCGREQHAFLLELVTLFLPRNQGCSVCGVTPEGLSSSVW